jgi:hypothetical protein
MRRYEQPKIRGGFRSVFCTFRAKTLIDAKRWCSASEERSALLGAELPGRVWRIAACAWSFGSG